MRNAANPLVAGSVRLSVVRLLRVDTAYCVLVETALAMAPFIPSRANTVSLGKCHTVISVLSSEARSRGF